MPSLSDSSTATSRGREALAAARTALPRGRTLPLEAWQRRHRWIVALVWSQVVATAILALALGESLDHVVRDELALVAFAVLASVDRLGRRARSCMASAGLLVASVLVVHTTQGLTEAHFYFFVMVVVLALYEDWLPFLLALGVVVLHHGIVGVIAPEEVYSSPQAIAQPIVYAFIHGGFVAAAGIAAVIGWRLNEDVRAAAVRSHARFRRSFEDAPIGMVLIADGDGAAPEVNRALTRMLGRPAEEIVELGVAGLTHPDDRAVAESWMARVRSGEVDAASYEVRILHPAGHRLWASVHLTALEDGTIVAQIVDVSDRHRVEEEAARRLERQRRVAALGSLALGGAPLWKLLVEAGEALLATLDAEAVDLLGADGRSLMPSAWPDARRLAPGTDLDDARLTAEPVQLADGRTFGTLAVAPSEGHALTAEDRYVVHAVAQVVGGAVRQQGAEEDLRHQSLHDALTGLPNRTLLADRLTHALARGQRTGSPLAVMFVDLDDFKLVNDGFGHHVGDALLQTLASRIETCLRPNDTLARFGGDELVVLCEDLADEDHAIDVAERIRASFEDPFDIDGQQHFLSASVGVATSSPAYYGHPDRLIRDADAAMYRAKAQGRNRVETFDDTMHERVLRRVEIEQHLRRAIDEDELRLHYQPLLRLDDGRVTKCEALVRWEHPTKGMLSPAEFVPIAEQSGLILRLGAWVLEEACRQLAVWRASDCEALREMRVSINLSAIQVAHDGVVGQIAGALERHGIPPEQLICELTETALIADPPAAARTLGALHDLGVRVALDDFGTGYSSLAALKQYPLSSIKLDRSFISAMAPGNSDEAIVASVVEMAHSLSLLTVAEGVETAEQRDALRALGCDIGQGFLFSRPLAVTAFEAAIRDQLVVQ